MANYFRKIYLVYWLVFVVTFIYLLFSYGLDIKTDYEYKGFSRILQYDIETVQDIDYGIGEKKVYSFNLENAVDKNTTLVFRTVHQEVNVYISDELVYSMRKYGPPVSGRSPGDVWNSVPLGEKDGGAPVRIELLPVYESVADIAPQIYVGDKYDILVNRIYDSLFSFVLSFLAVIVGLIFVIYVIVNHHKANVDKSLLMLGIFSIQLGIWKFTDTSAIGIVFSKSPAVSQGPFMGLMLMCIPFILFVKELYHDNENPIWYMCCIASVLDMSLALICQYFGVRDYRENLIWNHIVIIAIATISLVMAIIEVRKYGLSDKFRLNIKCLGICFLGTVIDLCIYYISDYNQGIILGMLAFINYILMLGISSVRETKRLVNIGQKAEEFKKLAYHDQMTGMYNRAAYAKNINDMETDKENCIILVMDLNNLKACNDTLGHEAGDIYISTCANFIMKCFQDIGKCYRMGGDEFSVIIKNAKLTEVSQRVENLCDMVKNSSKTAGFSMAIACGYKLYDKRIDFDLSDTARRADRMMYQQKFTMKEHRA